MSRLFRSAPYSVPKITVIDTKVFPELQKKYLADPKSGKCPFFNVGDTFVLKRTAEQDDFYHLINGKFCAEAWNAISRYVYSALQGDSIMRKEYRHRRKKNGCGIFTNHDANVIRRIQERARSL